MKTSSVVLLPRSRLSFIRKKAAVEPPLTWTSGINQTPLTSKAPVHVSKLIYSEALTHNGAGEGGKVDFPLCSDRIGNRFTKSEK